MNALKDAARAYQARVVIPHCAVCTKPCCNLDELVLDLDWPRARALYQITSSRRAFSRELPPHIREQGGRFYAHGKSCPAYVDKKCTVYGTDTKPPSCTDFPLYEDGDAVTADTRCEAIDLDEVQRALETTGVRVRREPDPQFPELVCFVPLDE